MREEEKKPAREEELPLKNGAGRIEIASARSWEKGLRDLLEKDPGHFRALQAIVEGRPEEVSQRHQRELVEAYFLSPDGSPHPAIKAVLAAALRDTPDGPVLVDPFDVSRPEDAATLLRADEERAAIRRQTDRTLRRYIDSEAKRRRRGKDKEPGR